MSDAGDKLRAVSGGAAYAQALCELAAQARLRLAILSYGLDARHYGSEAFVDVVKTLCLASERAQVRILVNQPELAMRQAHRLVELGRRLSSRIQFRQLGEDDRALVEELVIADERGLLQRERPEALEARLELDAPLAARLRLKGFVELWERGVPAREFSELRI